MSRHALDDAALPVWSRRWRGLISSLRFAPPWLTVQFGVALMALGAFLLVRPLSSLWSFGMTIAVGFILSGIADLVAARQKDTLLAGMVAWAWIITGAVMLILPALTLGGLSLVVVVALIVAGLAQLWGSRREPMHQRFTLLVLGVSSIVFGVVAFVWPDVTLLVVAVVFGARTLLLGLSLTWSALMEATSRQSTSFPGLSGEHGEVRSRSRNRLRVVGAVLAFFLALGVSMLSLSVQQARPALDAFYTPPTVIPSEPGRLIRAEPFSTGLPEGSIGWRILYTTTDTAGLPVVSSGLVVVPEEKQDEPWPLLAWAHGTTGYVENCAPSVLSDPFVFGALFTSQEVIDQGWAIVATDYPGMGVDGVAPYLVGAGESYAVLDSIRAAHQLSEIRLTQATVVWGHSQGGHAALWTGFNAEEYAPDVTISGIAALAPASDLIGLVDNLSGVLGGSVFASFVVASYADTYPEVNESDFVRPAARIIVREMSTRCLAEPAVYASALSAVSLVVDVPVFSTDPTEGAIGRRLEENIPRGTTSAPVLLAQAENDILIPPAVQDAYVQQLCDAGQPVDYRQYEGRDHPSLIDAESALIPQLLIWTEARFAGEPVTAPLCDTSISYPY